MTPDQYLARSEQATRHIFDGIRDYLERYRQLHWPAQARNQSELSTALRDLEAWRVSEFALAVLCGAVLQIADAGIDACCHNQTIPVTCAPFATMQTARYCVGREVHGLPLGAIIHFGVHWASRSTDDRAPGCSTFTDAVFNRLLYVYYESRTDFGRQETDAYRGQPMRVDSLVLTTIGWTSYDAYVTDMRDMLRRRDFDLASPRGMLERIATLIAGSASRKRRSA